MPGSRSAQVCRSTYAYMPTIHTSRVHTANNFLYSIVWSRPAADASLRAMWPHDPRESLHLIAPFSAEFPSKLGWDHHILISFLPFLVLLVHQFLGLYVSISPRRKKHIAVSGCNPALWKKHTAQNIAPIHPSFCSKDFVLQVRSRFDCTNCSIMLKLFSTAVNNTIHQILDQPPVLQLPWIFPQAMSHTK